MPRWLIGIETSSNQSYIFASNRLAESVGASFLLRQATTTWVLEALKTVLRVDDAESENSACRILQLSSGMSLIIVKDAELAVAEQIVTAVTLRALQDAPGLNVVGAIVQLSEKPDAQQTSDAVSDVTRRLAENASQLPGPAMRHLRLPITADCDSTGDGAAAIMPAPGAGSNANGERPTIRVSAAVHSKRRAVPAALRSLHEQLGEGLQLPRNVNELEGLLVRLESAEASRWLAVVHADINGLGQVMKGLGEGAKQDGYIADMRTFSKAVDDCVLNSLKAGLRAVPPVSVPGASDQQLVPVVPLIAGGDDLTVVLPGAYALRFAATYLRAVELYSARDEFISTVLTMTQGEEYLSLSACAGIAIVKAHHPFSDAYRVADELAASAKQVKQLVQARADVCDGPVPCSALDFELIYSAIGDDLAEARERLTVDGGTTTLHNRPYVVTPADALPQDKLDGDSVAWVRQHSLSVLDQRRELLSAGDGDDDGAAIPRSKLAALRSVLFEGRAVADARAKILLARTPQLGQLLHGNSLFLNTDSDSGSAEEQSESQTPAAERPAASTQACATDLLDLIDVLELSGETSILPLEQVNE